jgi:predicted ATPase
LARAFGQALAIHQYRREVQVCQERAETTMTLATEQGLPFWAAVGTIFRGWGLAAQGDSEAGLTQMRQGLTAWRATGAVLYQTNSLALLAEAYGKVGQTEDGLTLLAEALEMVHSTGEHFYEAEIYRLKGALLLSCLTHQPATVETCFRQALAVAQSQQAKSLELRAAMSLARLWQQQDKRQDAYDLLAPVYEWFTEGFDTADLQEAKALLETLRE